MSHQFEIAKQIVEETCPHRKLQLENIRLFANIIQCKKYHKGDIILGEGEVCNNLLYIEQGLLRQYYVKHGKDVTEHLSYEGSGVVWCIESYFHQTPTHLLMEALEPGNYAIGSDLLPGTYNLEVLSGKGQVFTTVTGQEGNPFFQEMALDDKKMAKTYENLELTEETKLFIRGTIKLKLTPAPQTRRWRWMS